MLVIGGGSVAMDVAVTARRLGAERVTVACLETCEEMPALLEEVDEALAEGVELAPSCGPSRVLRRDGRIVGMELVQCTSVFDEQACFAPAFDDSVRTTLEADEVILAVGQRVEIAALEAAGLAPERGRLPADPRTQRTGLEGVYAGGDVATGPSTVIAAMGAGRRAAEAIDADLRSGEAGTGPAEPADPPAPRLPAVRSVQRGAVAALRLRARGARRAHHLGGGQLHGRRGGGLQRGGTLLQLRLCRRDALGPRAGARRAGRHRGDDHAAHPGRRLLRGRARRRRRCSSRARSCARSVVPAASSGLRATYEKFRLRNAIDFPILSAAVALRVEDGRVADARVVLGAAAPVPLRVEAVERALRGLEASAETLGAAARAAAAQWAAACTPLPANAYKVKVAAALVARAVERAARA